MRHYLNEQVKDISTDEDNYNPTLDFDLFDREANLNDVNYYDPNGNEGISNSVNYTDLNDMDEPILHKGMKNPLATYTLCVNSFSCHITRMFQKLLKNSGSNITLSSYNIINNLSKINFRSKT